MVHWQFFRINVAEYSVQIAEFLQCAKLACIRQQPQEYRREHLRVVYRTMVVKVAELVLLGYGIKLVIFEIRQSRPAKRHGINRAERVLNALPLARRLDK